MSVWDAIVGQPKVVEELRRVAEGDGRGVAQSWLICGPAGSGTMQVARAFAAALESPDHGEGELPTKITSQILADRFPDVVTLSTDKVTIGIDEVRDLVVQNAGADVLTGLGEESRPGRNYHVAQYLERIDKAFACADLVICRSGAGTVSELTALGLPAVYVPLPIGNGEQRFNALPVSDAGGGIIVDDRSFTSQWVSAQVPGLLANPARLRSYGEHAWQYGIRDAADRMAREILSIADARV